jgi:DNA-binding XRE family transcriptional regulator
METKIQKEFVDHGFGFPVILRDVTMIKVRGEWTPKVDYNRLSLCVLLALVEKPARLTGSEIRFIRHHFEMTLQAFAKRFDVSHVAVMKWEKTKNRPTAMNWSTEKDIRLHVLSKLAVKPAEFSSHYRDLEEVPASKLQPIEVNAKTAA